LSQIADSAEFVDDIRVNRDVVTAVRRTRMNFVTGNAIPVGIWFCL